MVEKITGKIKKTISTAPMWVLIAAAVITIAIEIFMVVKCYNQRTLLDQFVFVVLARVCEALTKELNNRNKKEGGEKDEQDLQKLNRKGDQQEHRPRPSGE